MIFDDVYRRAARGGVLELTVGVASLDTGNPSREKQALKG